MLCYCCGSQGVHVACAGMPSKRRERKKWVCADCKPAYDKLQGQCALGYTVYGSRMRSQGSQTVRAKQAGVAYLSHKANVGYVYLSLWCQPIFPTRTACQAPNKSYDILIEQLLPIIKTQSLATFINLLPPPSTLRPRPPESLKFRQSEYVIEVVYYDWRT